MYYLDRHAAKIVVGLRRKGTFLEELQNARAQQGRGLRRAALVCRGGRALVQMGSRLVVLGRRIEQRSAAHLSA